MQKLLAMFAVLAVVTVQVTDFVMPESAQAGSALGFAAGGDGGDDPDPCDECDVGECAHHCPFHSLHHVLAQTGGAEVSARHLAGMHLSRLHESGTGMAYRPAIPPPLA